jgi:hypothetical protein
MEELELELPLLAGVSLLFGFSHKALAEHRTALHLFTHGLCGMAEKDVISSPSQTAPELELLHVSCRQQFVPASRLVTVLFTCRLFSFELSPAQHFAAAPQQERLELAGALPQPSMEQGSTSVFNPMALSDPPKL